MFFLSLSLFFLCFLFYKKELYDIKKRQPQKWSCLTLKCVLHGRMERFLFFFILFN